MSTITFNIPYDIGDEFIHDGKRYTVHGIHLYAGRGGQVFRSVRYYVGNNTFITIPINEGKEEQVC